MVTSSIERACCVCGKETKNKCSKCKIARYCCREHQKTDFKSHKKVCFPPLYDEDVDKLTLAVLKKSLGSDDVVAAVREFLPCTRCLKSAVDSTKCLVPHPRHLACECGGMFFGGEMRSNFRCMACTRPFSHVTSLNSKEMTIQGQQWCFEGTHSIASLPSLDERRVLLNTVSLQSGPDLQEKIDNLPSDVETLTITSSTFYDDSDLIVFDKKLPKLQKLQLIDIKFSKVKLTPETTPQIRFLRLQNVSDSCDMEIVLPHLRKVTVHFWSGPPSVIQTMLDTATLLESFDSYKLWSNDHLRFASAALTSIDLHRSDSLSSLSIWAPQLTYLGLQACYSLDKIEFPSTNLLAVLQPPFICESPLVVNTANANIGRNACRALREHPRSIPAMTKHDGMPTEGIFAFMHFMHGGGGGDWWDENDDRGNWWYEDDYDEDDEDDDDWDEDEDESEEESEEEDEEELSESTCGDGEEMSENKSEEDHEDWETTDDEGAEGNEESTNDDRERMAKAVR